MKKRSNRKFKIPRFRGTLLLDRVPVRFRLSIGHALWMAVLFLAVGFGLYRTVESRILSSVDAALLSSAKSIRAARFSKAGRNTPFDVFFKHFFRDPVYVDQFFRGSFVRPYAQLISMSGNVQSRTDNLRVNLPVTPATVARAEKGLVSYETFKLKDGKPLRQITVPVFREGRFTKELVQVGASLEEVYQNLRVIGGVLWMGFTLGLIGSVLVGWALARRALNPVRNISKAAGELGIADMSVRLPLPAANDELRELSITFNAMLDRLEEAVKRLRRFTGDVSHELRTPLAVLRGEAELALRRERSGDDYRLTLTTIAGEAIHMTKIVEDLLLLSRAEAKSVAMSWAEVSPVSFAEELRGFVISNYRERGVELELDVAADAPDFCASSNLLALALKNLLLNAAKHSAAESKVVFALSGRGDGVEFLVQDQGEGIPEESLPYIFDSFYRADTARNRASGGVGIGLSLAKALVMLHGGELAVESEVGEGSTFRAWIPLNLHKTRLAADGGPSQFLAAKSGGGGQAAQPV